MNHPSPGPALSATSDMPTLDISKPIVDAEPKPVDTKAKPDKTDGTSEAAKPEGEATGAEDKPGEAKKREPKVDETDPAEKAWMARERNRRQAAEQRAEYNEARLTKALEVIDKLTGEQEKKADPRPTRDAFEDPDAYDKALIDWSARAAKEAGKQEALAEARRAAIERQTEATLQTYQERAATFTETHPDWEDVALADDLKISAAMTSAIMSSEDGPAIAYYLGQNPETAERISKLSPVQAVYEIGRIASKLGAPAPKPKPAPAKPLGSRTTNGVSPDNESMEAYAARRNAEMRQAH
jgi:hypothetical protein